MVSTRDLKQLLAWDVTSNSRVLSVFLSTDPTKPTNLRRDHRRSYESVLQQMLQSIEAQLTDKFDREQFAKDAARVQQVVTTHQPRQKTLVVFCDDTKDFCWFHDLQIRLPDDAHWGLTPYLRPLLEALDEYERYGVVLTEHGRSRLFTVFMGEIEEHVDAFAGMKIHHLKSTGTDHLLSQKQFQQKAEVYAHRHLKHVAELLNQLVRDYDFDRLVLAGSVEPVAELERLLPKRLSTRIVGTLALPLSTTPDQVLKAIQDIIESAEWEAERRLVEKLLADAAGHRQAVTGLEPTLEALQEGRVWRLIYVESVRKAGWRCDKCSALGVKEFPACPYCGGKLLAVDDLIDAMAQRVAASSGKVEAVQGEAAQRLTSAGGIGAQLRF